MFRIWGDHIDKPLEKYLLAMYEEEPFPYEWDEQDLYEQIRKLIVQYNQGKLDIIIPSAEERQRTRYETLKESYIELLAETNRLKEIINITKTVLDKGIHSPSATESFRFL
jgi:DNA repair exonuclease SbcCD nuclease subunit